MARKETEPQRGPGCRRPDWTTLAALSVIMAVFAFHAVSLDFTQDDAYISFRYVKNLLAGHGLVFNPGERVEGYTNFLWIMILSLFAGLGFDPVVVSKILGVASGCLSLLILYKLSGLFFDKPPPASASKTAGNVARPGIGCMSSDEVRLLALVPPLLLASNGAFAYWTISGLETSLFVLGVLTTLYLYITCARLAVVSAAVTSLVRPEGVLVFLILILHSLIARRESVRWLALYIVGFALLLVPFLLFRLLYYGDPLPNPFYAKTGLALEYVGAGLLYFGRFLKDYGWLGGLYVLPIVLWRSLRPEGRLLLVVTCLYSLYVVLVGGDVLRGHRFFLPVVPFLYVLIVFSVTSLTDRLGRGSSCRIARLASLMVLAAATFTLPRASVLQARRYEMGLNSEMTRYAEALIERFGSDFTLAISTIGVISYMTDAKVIDMLGLTDPHIAKHPERIPGLTSTWKERRFNTDYLLSRDPDFIMFSTGYKPSALAEKALFLHSKFRRNYYIYSFRYSKDNTQSRLQVYKRKGLFEGTDTVFPNPAFVDLYSRAVHLYSAEREFDAAIRTLRHMFRVMPEDFARGYEFMGTCFFFKEDIDSAKAYALRAVHVDDYSVEAHMLLRDVYFAEGNKDAGRRHTRAILKYNAELLQPRLK